MNRRESLIAALKPRTVCEALRIPGVGRKTARKLLEDGLVADPCGLLIRPIFVTLAAGHSAGCCSYAVTVAVATEAKP